MLLFLLANFICSGATGDIVAIILPSSISEADKSLGMQLLSGAIIAIAVSPSLGYLVYSLSHAIFLTFGGWAGFYRRNNINICIDRCPDIPIINDVDAKASWYLYKNKEGEKYVEWIRRIMDVYLTSTAISLNIFITNISLFLMIQFSGVSYNADGMMFSWIFSMIIAGILLYNAFEEKKKAVEGFKVFFHQIANSSANQ